MFRLFINKAEFNGNLSRWQVGQVTDMRSMFYGATSFNGDLSGWDVGQVVSRPPFWDGRSASPGGVTCGRRLFLKGSTDKT